MRIVPNTRTDLVADVARPWLRPGNRVGLASRTLSRFAFGELAGSLASLAGAGPVLPPDDTEVDFLGSVEDGSVRNRLEGRWLAGRCATWRNRNDDPSFKGDLGLRVFKLDTSNLRAWGPTLADLEAALLAGLEHVEPGRTEQDILYELLLKLWLDLCIPIGTQTIAGKSVHAVDADTLMLASMRLSPPRCVRRRLCRDGPNRALEQRRLRNTGSLWGDGLKEDGL